MVRIAVRQRAGDPAIVLEVLSIYGYFDFDNRDEAHHLDQRLEPTYAGFKVRSTASTAAMSRVGHEKIRNGRSYFACQ
jgi:hypothetical protein